MEAKEQKVHKFEKLLVYILVCMNAFIWLFGILTFGMILWLRFDNEFRQWVTYLSIQNVYIGMYILIISTLITLGSGVLACVSIYSKNPGLLLINCGIQLFGYVLGICGAATLRDFTTYQSSIRPIIRDSMLQLINNYPLNDTATKILALVQEKISCCGADGPEDYMHLKRALPSQCRDTVTGNAFYHGCADELTWYLEQRSEWIVGLAMTLCFFNVMNAVISSVLAHLRKKDLKYYN